MKPTVAVVAQGEMGAAVGARLAQRGARVITCVEGRSDASVRRAEAAGIMVVGDQELAQADFFLSILPPSEAPALAVKMAALIAPTARKTIYVDCNAVAPATKRDIGGIVTKVGARFIDVGIIGSAPRDAYAGPRFYAAGPDADLIASLSEFGLDVHVMGGAVGAASAMKMSYASLTKGLTALGAMAALAAHHGGVAESLRLELERSQPLLLQWLSRMVPAMYPKAYRFVGEMEEVAGYLDGDESIRETFEAIAKFYQDVTIDSAGEQGKVGVLSNFFR